MRICLVAAEAAPFAKAGGLGDFTIALTRYLARAGHDVRLFFPAYSTIDWSSHDVGSVDYLRNIPVRLGARTLEFSGIYSHVPGSYHQVYAIHCPPLYDRPRIYTDSTDEPLRFGFLCRAAIECCQRMGWSPQIFHCNDWHTALLPVYLRSLYEWDSLFGSSRTVLTIHNIGYQGVFGRDSLQQIGLAESSLLFPREDLEADRVNFLKTGLLHADVITTVSPNHAGEIQREEYGMGLDGLLRRRADRLVGILNGVDYDEWDPAHDSLIPYQYSLQDLRGKSHNKRALLKELSLSFVPKTPLVGMVSRLVPQKGIDLLARVLPEALQQREFQLVVLGSGEPRYEIFFTALQERFSDRVVFYKGYNNELAHRIEAASDIYLMPSVYEPCGLNQMYSLRYGAVPVVRRTGGLADSVEQFDPDTGEGTGFLFDQLDAEGLAWSLNTALEVYQDRPTWLRIVRNGMSRDFSWKQQVNKYLELYGKLLV